MSQVTHRKSRYGDILIRASRYGGLGLSASRTAVRNDPRSVELTLAVCQEILLMELSIPTCQASSIALAVLALRHTALCDAGSIHVQPAQAGCK